MRLFIAAYPPPSALDHLADALTGTRLGAAAAAGTNVRLVRRHLWHVTVAFLGEVADHRVATVTEAVREGVRRWRADGGTPPVLRLAGAGRFGRGPSTVLWVGLSGEVDAFRSLGLAVRAALRRRRLPFDTKPLHPHLTLARPGGRLPADDIAADLATLGSYEGPEWRVDQLAVVSSRPGPTPVHEQLVGVPLVDPS